MKKVFFFLMMLMIGLGTMTVSAQQTLTVADGTTTNDYVPVYGLYEDYYLQSQTIYPDNLLTSMVGEPIQSMTFYVSGTPTLTSTFEVKLGITTDTTFGSAFLPSPTTTVYTGTFNISNGMVTLNFTTPFQYTGGNLLMEVSTVSTNGDFESTHWYGISSTASSISGYSSSGLSSITPYVRDFIPKTTFAYGTISCYMPSNFTVDSATTSSIYLSWADANNTGATYTIYDLSDTSIVASGLSDLSYEVSGLSASTLYRYALAADCGGGDMSGWVLVNARTACGVSSIPLFEGFEGSSCWSIYNCHTNTGLNEDGNHSGNAGFGFYYTTNPPQYLISPEFTPSTDPLLVEFYYKNHSSSFPESFQVGYSTTTNDISEFTWGQEITISNLTWTLYSEAIPAGAKFISIKCTSYDQYYLYIDDISIANPPACATVNNLTADSTSATSVYLSWNDIINTGVTYTIYDMADTSIVASGLSDMNYEVTGLTTGQTYTFALMVDCGGGQMSNYSNVVTAVPGAYFMSTSGWDTLHTCSTTIYDNGGPTADYASSCDAYLVIYPDQPGNMVSITGTFLSESPTYDYLIFYDGVGAATANQLFKTAQSSGVLYTIPTVTSTTGPMTIYFHSDGTAQYAGFELSATCVSCVAPSLTLGNVSVDEATISWNYSGTQTDFEVVYGPVGFNPDSVQAQTVSNANSYTFTGLTSNTSYDAYIRTVCDVNENSPWSHVLNFTTLNTLAHALPYTCDFEDTTENANWMIVNGTCTNQWFFGTAANNTSNGTTALYVSDDNGTSNSYDNSTSSSVWAYRDFDFTGYGEYMLSFDWRCYGEGSGSYLYDYVRVYIGNPVSPTAGSSLTVPAGATELQTFNMDSTWNTAHISIDGTQFSGTKRLYFLWRNDYSSGENPAGAIDNISITGVSCARPNAIVASQITPSSADISWNRATATDGAWDVVFATQSNFNPDTVTTNVINTNDTFVSLSGLDANTMYYVYVRTDCGSGNTSNWTDVMSFRTSCGAMNITYTESFENHTSGSAPLCWTVLGGNPTVSSSSYNAHGGSQYLDFRGTYHNMIAFPTFTQELNTLQVRFWTRPESTSNSSCGTFSVGYMTDITDTTTFVALQTYSYNSFSAYDEKTVVLSNAPTGAILAFVHNANATNYYWYVDDVVVEVIPTCLPISDLTVDSTTTNSVFLSWTDTTNAGASYTIYDMSDTSVVISNLSATNYEVSNLLPATTYTFAVETDCGGGDLSALVSVTTTTQCSSFSIPFTENFETLTTSEAPLCWTVLGGNPTVRSSSSNAHGGSQYLDFRGTYHNMIAFPTFTQELNTLQVRFWTRPESFTNSSCGTFSVGYMTNISDTTTFVALQTYSYNSFTAYDEKTVVMSSAPAGAILAFVHNANSTYYYWYVDDVVVEVIPSCPSVSNLTVSATTNSSVTLTWTEQGSATNWNVEYGPTGFTQGQGTTVPVATTPTTTIQNLTSGTAYDFYVQAACNTTDMSGWTGPVSAVPGSYNVPTSGTHTVSMCGGTIYDDGGLNGNYSSNMDVTVTVNPDVPGQMVQLSGSYDLESGWDYLIIYDGADNTGTELFRSSTSYSDPDQGTITAITSTTGPLTIYFYSDGSQTYGGFELQVNCVGGVTPQPDTCAAPTNLTATGMTKNSVVLNWTENGDATSWTVNYREASAENWSTVTVSNKPYTLTSLQPETTYSWYVVPVCTDVALPSATETFTTLPDGIADYELTTTLYPNPNNGHFTINNEQLTINNVDVYDVYGKLLKSVKVNANSVMINAQDLSAGMYIVRISTDKGTVTKNFVKK